MGRIGSTAILNAFSIISLISRASREVDVSKQGFLFTYISHVLHQSSIMKSKPNISNTKSLPNSCILWCVDSIASLAKDTMLGQISLLKLVDRQLFYMYLPNASNDNLLPDSYLPQSALNFCTASFVKWMYLFPTLSVLNNLHEVRAYPSSYQYALNLFRTIVTKTQHLMSNFLRLYKRGITYSWIITLDFFSMFLFKIYDTNSLTLEI